MRLAKTRLGASRRAVMTLLKTRPDLREGPALNDLLGLLAQRRAMDLTDLSPSDQASLIAARAQQLLPSVGQLMQLLTDAHDTGRQLVVKFGIDPTAADVHVGHAVSMIIASRFPAHGTSSRLHRR